jgi:hypothetical protein
MPMRYKDRAVLRLLKGAPAQKGFTSSEVKDKRGDQETRRPQDAQTEAHDIS